jgi:hypothetical protein
MKKSIFYLLGLFLFLMVACQKTPGTGGKAKINVHVVDGNSNIPFTEIKIKYGSNAYPGETAAYDNTILGDQYGKCVFDGMQRGDYYIYTSYTDTLGALREGGAYVKINNKPGEQHIVIDMDEEDPF